MDAFRPPGQMIAQDWSRLAEWLSSRGMQFGGEPRQFSGGLANLNYLVQVDGRDVVLRRPPAGPSAEGANDMAREWRVLSGLHGHFDLAPAPIAFCDDPSVLGAPFQLLEFRAGQPIGATLPSEVDAKRDGERLTGELITAMTTLHAVDPEEMGLGTLGRPEGFLDRQVEGWARRSTAAFGTDEPASVTPILAALRAQPPEPGRVSLLHCDFKFDNLLFDLSTLKTVAVVDWDMATRGDPLFDLGVLLSYWVQPEDPANVHTLHQVPSLEAGFPTRAELAAQYFAAAGQPAQDLRFHFALARLRLAVAWQQMYVQYRRGALIDERYAGFGDLAVAILDWTADTLHQPID